MFTSTPSKPSALVVEWQMRLEELRAQLRLQPNHPKVWQWRMEEKVLVFMLARYGELAALNPLPASPPLYMAQGAWVEKVKGRLSRLRRRQLLEDIEAKNQEHETGFMDRFFADGDAYLQEGINRRRKKRQRGYY